MGAKRSATGDIRLDKRTDWLLERIVASHSLVVRELGGKRSGEIAAHRLLSADKVGVNEILEPHVARTAAAARGHRIIAIQDTTEINFAGRDRRRKGLGPAGDGVSKGFFIHPVIAVDADDEAVLGIVGAEIWTRGEERTPPSHERAFEDKESVRWLNGAKTAARHLAKAGQVILVGDRESDIYPLFARKPEGVDLLVRAAQDRSLAPGGSLFQAPATWTELDVMEVRVAPRGPGDKGRVAKVAVKAGKVEIKKPYGRGLKADPKSLELGLVEAREIDAPKGVTPLLWRLVTTLPVATRADAEEIIRLYRLRWRIEQLFRTLKSDGLKLEDSQVEEAERLFKLAILGLIASARIMQLVDARDGSSRPATDVIDGVQIEPVGAIGATLEGATERQKNPHAKASLSWLSWIAARLGGWNCYYKPPGPKTMARGWERLAAMLDGFTIARELQDV
jgi:Transposase DDE domain